MSRVGTLGGLELANLAGTTYERPDAVVYDQAVEYDGDAIQYNASVPIPADDYYSARVTPQQSKLIRAIFKLHGETLQSNPSPLPTNRKQKASSFDNRQHQKVLAAKGTPKFDSMALAYLMAWDKKTKGRLRQLCRASEYKMILSLARKLNITPGMTPSIAQGRRPTGNYRTVVMKMSGNNANNVLEKVTNQTEGAVVSDLIEGKRNSANLRLMRGGKRKTREFAVLLEHISPQPSRSPKRGFADNYYNTQYKPQPG